MRVALLAMSLLGAALANAEVLDNVDVSTIGDKAEITIKFSLVVRYLRHSPAAEGDTLRIFVLKNPLDQQAQQDLDREYRKSPPKSQVPPFTVTYIRQDSSILVKFKKAVSYTVEGGKDQRSIKITVNSVAAKSKPAATAAAPVAVTPSPEQVSAAPVEPVRVPDERAGAEASTTTPSTQPSVVPPVTAAAPRVSPDASTPPVSVPSRTVVSVPDVGAGAEVAAQAQTLLNDGRKALQDGNVGSAIQTINKVLNLPPNPSSQEAQELIGMAREKANDFTKARAEYELYLKLYPSGEGADRVKKRLATLGTGTAVPTPAPVVGARPAEAAKQPTVRSIYGSLSQFYYRGASKVDTTNKDPNQVNPPQLNFTDQSSLITNLDFNARFRDNESDKRFVLRDNYTANFLDTSRNVNKLTAAYYDQENKSAGFGFRVGRQPANGYGVQERFNGLQGKLYNNAAGLQFSGVVGKPIDATFNSSRKFYGVGMDVNRPSLPVSGDVYLINQEVDGITDRRALGTEVRFFKGSTTMFSLLDYDLMFKTLNIFMVQASTQTAGGATLNAVFDKRKSPTMQVTNALVGEATTSVRELLDSGISEQELRRRALGVTSTSTLYLFGLTVPVSAKWQLGGDYRVNRISGTEGNGGLLPPTDPTPDTRTYSLQGIGTGLFGTSDITVLSFSLIEGPTFTGKSYGINSIVTLREKWRIETALRLFSQKDNLGTTQKRISPTLRLSYKLRDSISLEGEAGLEDSTTENSTSTDKSKRHYYSIGYRWDFN